MALLVPEMKVSWDESRPRSLNFVRTRLKGLPGQALRNDRRILRLNCNGLEGRFARFDAFVTASNGSARTDRGNQDVHFAIGVLPDFFGRRLAVHRRIGRILKLLRNPGIWNFFGQLLGFRDGAFHAFSAGREDQFGAQHRQQGAPFQRHGFGHRQDQLVTPRGRHERQRDAGIAAGRLDERRVRVDDCALFGIFNHGHADAVFDTAQRVEEFALQQNGRRHSHGHFVQFHQRSAPNRFDDVFVNASHKKILDANDNRMICVRG